MNWITRTNLTQEAFSDRLGKNPKIFKEKPTQ